MRTRWWFLEKADKRCDGELILRMRWRGRNVVVLKRWIRRVDM